MLKKIFRIDVPIYPKNPTMTSSSKAKGHREERLAALLVLRQLASGPLAGTIVEGVQPLLGAGDVGNIYIGYMLIIGCLDLEVHKAYSVDDV